jgi:hypothetical protein
LLQDVVAECIQDNFLVVDLRSLTPDLAKMSATLIAELEESARAYMKQYEWHSSPAKWAVSILKKGLSKTRRVSHTSLHLTFVNNTFFQASIGQEGSPMEPPISSENWRDLARQLETEDDPVKMIVLIEKLLATYDAEKMRGSVSPGANAWWSGSAGVGQRKTASECRTGSVQGLADRWGS